MKTILKNRHFVNLESLSTTEINSLIERSLAFKRGEPAPDFSDKTLVNLFFENSTRTRSSFEMAEHRLNMYLLPFETVTSSVQKGETLLDTCKTLEAIGADGLVIRHGATGYYEELLATLDIPIINAGDGSGQHPSQSLLDLMTMVETYGTVEGKVVVICGDLQHSRVARSNADILKRLGAIVYGSGPVEWYDPAMGIPHLSMDEAVEQCDILMLLRVQHERHDGTTRFDPADYHATYGLTHERMNRLKNSAIVLHPAPVNRGVEIADELVEHPRSRIFEQMKNGVFARMAILEWCFSTKSIKGDDEDDNTN